MLLLGSYLRNDDGGAKGLSMVKVKVIQCPMKAQTEAWNGHGLYLSRDDMIESGLEESMNEGGELDGVPVPRCSSIGR